MKSLDRVTIILITALLLSGCASTEDVLKHKASGTAKVYPVESDRAWKIAQTILKWEGAEDIELHRPENYMTTTIGANLVSYGSVVGVWVEPAKKGSTKVTVVTMRKVSMNLATGLTETRFHDRFEQVMEYVKAGKPVPEEAPGINESPSEN
jgi:hypothetical protein